MDSVAKKSRVNCLSRSQLISHARQRRSLVLLVRRAMRLAKSDEGLVFRIQIDEDNLPERVIQYIPKRLRLANGVGFVRLLSVKSKRATLGLYTSREAASNDDGTEAAAELIARR